MNTQLEVKNVTFSYGKENVFSDLSIGVKKGDILCVLGANGCGKTTLFRCLNGMLKLAGGHVLLYGEDIQNMSVVDVAQHIAVVPQEHNAPFPFEVLDVVSMGRTPHLKAFAAPSGKDMKIAGEALEMMGIGYLKNKRYTQISGGERQMVLIARAVTQQPEIILLDEPTSHLDFRNQALVLNIIRKLSVRGITIIMTTHLPNQAFLLSSIVALMHQGRFIRIGMPEKVITADSLRQTYGIEVSIVPVDDPVTGNKFHMCMPVLERESTGSDYGSIIVPPV